MKFRNSLNFELMTAIVRVLGRRNMAVLQTLEKVLAQELGKGHGYETSHEVKFLKEIYMQSPRAHSKPVIFDIGANLGQYLNPLMDSFPFSKILAFEPSSNAAAQLRRSFVDRRNLEIVEIALGNSAGEAVLYFDEPGSVLASLLNRDLSFLEVNFSNQQKVQVTKLDDFCAKTLTYPEIIKLDVEGFELEVLRGGSQTVEQVELIQFEFGGANRDSRTFLYDFYDFFQGKGFSTFYRITPSGLIRLSKYREIDESFIFSNYIVARN